MPTPDAYEMRLVTSDASGTHTTTPGTPTFGLNNDGVTDLLITFPPGPGGGTFRGTGALLPTGLHILTAAHVVTNNSGALVPGTTGTVEFEVPGGSVFRNVSSITVHPSYNGNATSGNDIAVITLSALAPAAAPRYNVFTGSVASAIGAQSIKVGFGQSGHGNTGATTASGTKRAGLNEYDADARDVLSNLGGGSNPFGGALPAAGASIAYDFDNGTANQNAMVAVGFASDTGFGNDEVNSAPGDSGGPTFVFENGEWRIAGVTSYGFGFTGNPDISNGTNSSFGEISVDMFVPGYAAFLTPFVPEPGSMAFVLTTLLALGTRRRKA
jgi:secreted trypsin-like serine protease